VKQAQSPAKLGLLPEMLPHLELPAHHHLLAKLVESAQVPVLHLSIATLNANR
jgi:hypothetical protein